MPPGTSPPSAPPATIGVLSGSGHPHWAMAAAAVPLAGADLPSSVYRGIHRIVGTCLGLVVVAAVLLPWPGSPLPAFPGQEAAVLACLVIVLQFTTELFMTRHYGLAMVSFTPVILLIGQLAAPADPHVLMTERAVETLVGAVVGILVVVLVRRRRTGSRPDPDVAPTSRLARQPTWRAAAARRQAAPAAPAKPTSGPCSACWGSRRPCPWRCPPGPR